jgi:endonuclease YncB( thermonuclease family)
VTCKQVDVDARNDRPVAQCFAGDDDLQALMVAAGWAWP